MNESRTQPKKPKLKWIALLILAVHLTQTAEAATNEFLVYTPNASSGAPRADKDFPIVDTANYKGAIVPAEEAKRHRYLARNYKDFWTPAPEQIAKAEAKVSTFIDDSTSTQAAEIRKKLKLFRRQYVGYSIGGEKRILCSFLPGAKEGQDPFAGLRRSFIKVYDGGPSFWQIHYRVEKDQCDHFYLEGGI
jgi:hypothetical protein